LDTDVLIVGAGPTGLMLANQLGRRGVRAMIIDRHSGPSLQTRALGVQARTLEIYDKLGIAERAVELGKPADGANIWATGRHMGRVPFGDAGKSATRFPYILVLGQDDNERIVGEKLRDWNMSVQWNTELTGIEQHADHVVATLKKTDGAIQTIKARWVAGCDGSRSAVRELNAITFPGAPYEHVFFVADVAVTGNMMPNEVNVYLWKDGFHLFFPMRGQDHWRIVGILPASVQDKRDVTFDDVVPSVRGEAGANLTFKSCTWFSTYRIHHRSASRFRAGRCFVLGDAAHIHSPMGAQGMNTGLQDAYNLGWKLAAVVKGHAKDSLLDSYEEERVPVAKQLLNTTDRAFRIVVSDSWLAGLLRTKVLARIAAFAMRRQRIQQAAFRVVSQLAIHYRSSSLSKSLQTLPSDAPQAGERFPWLQLKLHESRAVEDVFKLLDDRQWNLILIGQEVSNALSDFGDLLRVVSVPSDADNAAELARVHIPAPAFYLLRPDGHIGLCGVGFDADAAQRYLSENAGFVANDIRQ
jgi:2-polyprenyl-6-methoxyphenol hydroxylase-like FAD-dependent oxidoreductase